MCRVPKLRLPQLGGGGKAGQEKAGDFLVETEGRSGLFGRLTFPKVRIPFRRANDQVG